MAQSHHAMRSVGFRGSRRVGMDPHGYGGPTMTTADSPVTPVTAAGRGVGEAIARRVRADDGITRSV